MPSLLPDAGRPEVGMPEVTEKKRLRLYKYYSIFLVLYASFSVAAQFGSATPVDLSFLFGEGWWVPLGTITLVPFVDVSRSFAQHYAEQTGMSTRVSFALMMSYSFLVSLGFSILGSLPVNICLATVVAVNIGGFVDLLIFRHAIQLSRKPHIRMLFSNLAAAFSGGALFYWIAFSDLLNHLANSVGLSYENPMIMNHLLKGWFCQSLSIWLSGVGMALLVGKWLEWRDRQSYCTAAGEVNSKQSA